MQGASQIYRRLLHPYLDKYEGDIDHGLEEMRAGATRKIQSLGASAASEIAKAVTRQGSTAVRMCWVSLLELFRFLCVFGWRICLKWLLMCYGLQKSQ